MKEILGEEERSDDKCYLLLVKLKKSETHKYLLRDTETINKASFIQFVDDALENKVDKYFKSEKAPTTPFYENSNILKVVALNFEEIVFK